MRALALGLLAASLTVGCVEIEGFDPVGDVASIAGTWTIDGAPPRSQSCDALGAERVRVTFLDDRRPVTHSALFFLCRLGSFDTSDVRGSGAVVRAGTWTVRLDAIDGSGALVAAGPPSAPISVSPPGPGEPTPSIAVPPADFLSATLSARFLVGGEDANGARCASAGIAEVALVFDEWSPTLPPAPWPAGYSPPVDPGAREPCEVGFLGTRLAPGHYVVHLRALDAGGATLRESAARAVELAAGQALALDAAGPIEL